MFSILVMSMLDGPREKMGGARQLFADGMKKLIGI